METGAENQEKPAGVNSGPELLRIGHVIVLKNEANNSFVAADAARIPQVFAEDLKPLKGRVDYPPELLDCRFQLTQKFQYKDLAAYAAERARRGMPPLNETQGPAWSSTQTQIDRKLSASFSAKQSRKSLVSGSLTFSDNIKAGSDDAGPEMSTKSFKGFRDEGQGNQSGGASTNDLNIEGLEDKFLYEKTANQEQFMHVVGEPVLYGQVVQLRHVSTGYFVSIRKTAADLEKGTLKVCLEREGSMGSWFEIQSGFRTKKPGSRVYANEVVTFVAGSMLGSHIGLHTSVREITDPNMLSLSPHPYLESTHEINACQAISSMKIVPFCYFNYLDSEELCGFNTITIADLQAGSTVQDMLTADFTSKEGGELQCFFESPSNRSEDLLYNASAPSDLWRIEPESLDNAGMPIKMGTRFRLRHIVSGQFLMLKRMKEDTQMADTANASDSAAGNQECMRKEDEEGHSVTLTLDYQDPFCVWSLVPFLQEGKLTHTIDREVFAFLLHEATGTKLWLGVNPRKAVERSLQTKTIPTLLDLEEPHGDVVAEGHSTQNIGEEAFPAKAAILLPRRQDRDVLRLSCVHTQYVQKVRFVVEMTVVLKCFLQELRRLPFHSSVWTQTEGIRLKEQAREATMRGSINMQYTDLKAQREAISRLLFTNLDPIPFTNQHDKHNKKPPMDVMQHLFQTTFKLRVAPLMKRMIKLLDSSNWLGSDEPEGARIYQGIVISVGLINVVAHVMRDCPMKEFGQSELILSAGKNVNNDPRVVFDKDIALLTAYVMECGNLCHATIQGTARGNTATKLYVAAHHLATIRMHLGSPLKAANTLAVIFTENPTLIQQLSSQTLGEFVELVRSHGRRPHFIRLLYMMCGTPLNPIVKNQNLLRKFIWNESEEQPQSLLKSGFFFSVYALQDASMEKMDDWIVYYGIDEADLVPESAGASIRQDQEPSTPSSQPRAPRESDHYGSHSALLHDSSVKVKCSAKEFKKPDLPASIWEWKYNDQKSAKAQEQKKNFVYHVTSLNLIAAMCHGHNIASRDAFLAASDKYKLGLDFPTLRDSAMNQNLPYVLRSALVKVLMVLYVDLEPVLLPRFTRMLKHPRPEAPTTTITSESTHDGDKENEENKAPELVVAILEMLRVRWPRSTNLGLLADFHSKVLNLPGSNSVIVCELGVLLQFCFLDSLLWLHQAAPQWYGNTKGEEHQSVKEKSNKTKSTKILDKIPWIIEENSSVNSNLGAKPPPNVIHNSKSMFVKDLLEALHEMCRLGMVALQSESSGKVIKLMLDILKNHDCMPLDQPARFCLNSSTLLIMKSKLTILHILDFILEMHNDHMCERAFEAFQNTPDPPAKDSGSHESITNHIIKRSSTLGTNPNGRKKQSQVVPANPDPGPGSWWHNVQWGGNPEVDMFSPTPSGLVNQRSPTKTCSVLGMDNGIADNKHANGFLQLDPAGDGWDQENMRKSVVGDLVELVRYQWPPLVIKTFEVMDHLLSKRKQLITSLLSTFVVSDPMLVRVEREMRRLVMKARKHYQLMGSLNNEEDRQSCTGAVDVFKRLTAFLKPYTEVQLDYSDADENGTQVKSAPLKVNMAIAANCQFILKDLRVHELALSFLRRPLRRVRAKDCPGAMPEVDKDQTQRRDVFNQCLHFLRHFMVAGPLTPAGIVNEGNQGVIIEHIDVLLSLVGIQKLLVADTFAALFYSNRAAVLAAGTKVVHRFMKLVRAHGEHKKAHWLNLLRNLMVVNGPVRDHQTIVLQLLVEHKELLLLYPSDNRSKSSKKIIEQMKSDLKLLTNDENLAERSEGCHTAYHEACVQLLADICVGAEPTFIVQISEYINLEQVLDVLLMKHSSASQVPVSTSRFLQAAYWRLLHYAFLSGETESTSMQVATLAHLFWRPSSGHKRTKPGYHQDSTNAFMSSSAFVSSAFLSVQDVQDSEEEDAEDPPPPSQSISESTQSSEESATQHSCLIDMVVETAQYIMRTTKDIAADNEGTDALQAYTTALHVMGCINAALIVYFERHYEIHAITLSPVEDKSSKEMVDKQVVALYTQLNEYQKHLRNNSNPCMTKTELESAINDTTAVMNKIMQIATFEDSVANCPKCKLNQPDHKKDKDQPCELCKTLKRSSEESSASVNETNTEKATHTGMKSIQNQWEAGVKDLAKDLSVFVNKLGEPIEYKINKQRGLVIERAPMFMMARMLSQPHDTKVGTAKPDLVYEQVIAALCQAVAKRTSMHCMTEVTLVRLTRSIRGALRIATGPRKDGGALVPELQYISEAVDKVKDVVTSIAAIPTAEFGSKDSAAWEAGWRKLGLMQKLDEFDVNNPSPTLEGLSSASTGPTSLSTPSHAEDSIPWEMKCWQQAKYDRLGATKTAIRLMAHDSMAVQYEATLLLTELLEGGQQQVQHTVYVMMLRGESLTTQVLLNISQVFKRCVAALEARLHVSPADTDSGGDHVTVAEAKGVDQEVFHQQQMSLNSSTDPVDFAVKMLMCLTEMVEGHFHDLQTFLSYQPNNMMQVDVLMEGVRLLGQLLDLMLDSDAHQVDRNTRYQIPDLMLHTLRFLAEMVQGPCRHNQEALTSTRTGVITICNRFLGFQVHQCSIHIDAEKQKPLEEELEFERRQSMVKKQMLTVMMCLLEGLTSLDPAVRIIEALDFAAYEKQICHLYKALGFLPESNVTEQYPKVQKGAKVDMLDAPQGLRPHLEEELLMFCSFIFKLNILGIGRWEPVLPWLQEIFESNKSKSSAPERRVTVATTKTVKEHLAARPLLTEFLLKRLGYVEIMFQNQVEPVFFKITESCQKHFGSKQWKRQVWSRLNASVSPECRFVPTLKAAEFTAAIVEISHSLEHDNGFNSAYVGPQHGHNFQKARFALGFIIIVIMVLLLPQDELAWYEKHFSYQSFTSVRKKGFYSPLMTTLLCVQCLASVCSFVAFAYMNIFSSQVSLGGQGETGGGPGNAAGDGEMEPKVEMRDPQKSLESEAFLETLGVEEPPSNKLDTSLVAQVQDNVLVRFLREHDRQWWSYFLYNHMIVLASFLALLRDPYYMCFVLFDIFVESKEGLSPFKAIAANRVSGFLLQAFTMGLLAITFTGIITYRYFKDEHEYEDRSSACDTLYQCVMSHLVSAIMTGSIHEVFHEAVWKDVPISINERPTLQLLLLMCVSFYIVWNYVLLNIFVGVITSAFESDRDDIRTIFEDSSSRCMVCSSHVHELERNTAGFKHHIRVHHNVFNYIGYVHFLLTGDPLELTGPDTAVHTRIHTYNKPEERASWIPISRSMSLRSHQIRESEEKSRQEGMLRMITQRLLALEGTQNRLMASILEIQEGPARDDDGQPLAGARGSALGLWARIRAHEAFGDGSGRSAS